MTIHIKFTTTQALHAGSIGFLLPVISLFLLREGLSPAQLGVYTATFGLTVFFLEIPFGILADQFGRIRTFQMALASQCAGCGFLLAGGSTFLLFSGAVLFGVSRALTSGTIDAWYVDQLKNQSLSHEIHRRIGYSLMISTTVAAVVALAGGVLQDLLGTSLFSNPYRLNILLTGLAGALVLSFVWLVFENDGAESRRKERPLRAIPSIMIQVVSTGVRDAGLRNLISLTMLVGYVIASVETYWQPTFRLSAGGTLKTWYFGLLTTAIFLAKGLGNGASSWLHGRLAAPGGRLQLYCFSGIALCFFGLQVQRNPLLVATLLLGIYSLIGIIGPTIDAEMHQQVPNYHRGSIASLFSQVFQLGAALGGLTMGYFVSISGIAMAWTLLGSVVLLFALIILLLPRLFGP